MFFVAPDEDSDDEDGSNSYPFFDPEITSQLDENKVDKSQDTAESEGDALSSVTDTYEPSPNKFYPGVAQLCTENLSDDASQVPSPALRSYVSCTTNSKKETLID